MQENFRAVTCQQEQKNQIKKVIESFDAGDVDLARRILVASYRHHTRPALSVNERLNLMWCLTWFAFYEGCMEKGEKIVRQIIALEESLVVRREHKLIHAKFILSIFCASLGESASAEKCKNEVKNMLKAGNFQSEIRELIFSELDSSDQIRSVPYLQPVEHPAHHLSTNSAGHEPLFAVS